MGIFNEDLILGQNAERHFAEWLKSRNFTNVTFNESRDIETLRKYDITAIKGNSRVSFEVKFDRYSRESSNVVFETHRLQDYGFTLSGALTSKAIYWIQYIRNPDVFTVVKTNKLKRFLLQPQAFGFKAHRFITMGDIEAYGMKKSLGYLVSKDKFLAFVRNHGKAFIPYDVREIVAMEVKV